MHCDEDVAIAVAGLGKCYRLFERPQDRLKQGFLRRRKFGREFWALHGVTFAVGKGETIGIVGRNGSGKSTLLQMIAGTLHPTTGAVHLQGRVAAILELGAGFNPEFTGRENVYVNGAILGLTREEIHGHFEEIVSFAEIGSFIDQPVKTYSSGMVVRLAFAIQAVVPKDVLIVDEVLAVGDDAFRGKCFAKIEDFRKRGGTILLASHDAQLVIQLCTRALLLEHGALLLQGRTKPVVHLYQRLVHAPVASQDVLRQEIRELGPDWDEDPDVDLFRDRETTAASASAAVSDDERETLDPTLVPKNVVRYESRGARIQDPHLTKLDGRRVNVLVPGKTYVWRYGVLFDKRCTNVRFGMLIKTVSGLELGGRVTAGPGRGTATVEKGTTVEVLFKFRAALTSGTYFLNAGVASLLPGGEVYLDRWVDAGVFRVLPGDEPIVGHVDFTIDPQLLSTGLVLDG